MIVHQPMRATVWPYCAGELDKYKTKGVVNVHAVAHGDRVCVETSHPDDTKHVGELIRQAQTQELAARREARLAAKRRHYQTL